MRIINRTNQTAMTSHPSKCHDAENTGRFKFANTVLENSYIYFLKIGMKNLNFQ